MGKEMLDQFYESIEKAKKYDKLTFLIPDELLRCSFCGKTQNDVKKLVAGNNVYICDECVGLCLEIIEEESKSAE